MKKFYLLFLLALVYSGVQAQLDTTNISISNYRLHEGTHQWRGTGTYFDRTTFDSSPYIEGHLRRYNGEFRQNYRLLVPQGYNATYKPGYPLMLVFHGAVERANCFDGKCYHGTTAYNPNTQPIVNETSDLNNLLNNDHQLIHGAVPHINAWNLAGSKLPNDPNLGPREFPGFVLYPQMFNGWFTNDIRDAIRTVRLLIKKYNIDPNRIYTHGLSNGGRGLLNALVEAEWLFAAAAPMSAITSHNVFRDNATKVSQIPIWFFQGGLDDQPTPASTETTVRIFREAGGVARYTLYPNLGHGTWNTAYKEPDFFSWFLGKNKTDIHVAFGSPFICATTGAPAKLSVARGFQAYQWERNGQIIAGATTYSYDATQPGIYRARFSRVSANPTEEQWNSWSKPVTINEASPTPPVLDQIGSIVLNDLNGLNTARLLAPEGFEKYQWYKDGVLTTLPNTRTPTFPAGANTINAGTYTLVTSSFDNCPSTPSNPKRVFFSNQAPVNIPRPTGFTASLTGPTNVLLRWNDVSGAERNYELWRRKSTDAQNAYTFVGLLPEDAVQYEDRNLEPGTEYWYKIRAVSDLGRSDYAPGNSRTNRAENLIISTQTDSSPPTPPQNLVATLTDTDIATKTASISLSWSASTDDGGIRQYQVKYGATTILTNSTQTTFVISGLPLNTFYNFTVQAIDLSNNISSPSNQAAANSYIDGFYWEHSTGAFTDIRDIPASVWDNPEFEGRSPNLTLDPRTQEDFLVFRFYGYLYVTTPGEYLIRVRSNDGVQLFLNGQLYLRRNGLVNDGLCSTTNPNPIVPITLPAGAHSIEVRYFQYSGDKCLSFQWQGPDAGPNPTRFYDIPNNRIRSYPTIVPPQPPLAPENLQAEAVSMTQINLTWTFSGTPPAEYEIHRSLSETGTFTVVNRVATTNYADQNLVPATTYFYKVRTVNANGTSEFTPVVSATTLTDDVPPSAPTALTLYSKTLTSASIGWTKSTDNTAVTGYEIWVNNILHSTTPNNFAVVTGLEPMTNYTIYVVAYDANQNKSAPSNSIVFDTSQPDVFYSKPTGNLNVLATWGKNQNGTGDAPANFTTNGSFFIVSNRTTSNVGGAWKVDGAASKILVPAGVTLTAESALQGRVEVANNGTLVLANATIPTLVNLGIASTVRYEQNASQIFRTDYGNVILNGAGNKTFASGTTTILGSLNVANGVAVKGAGNNQSTVVLHGDLTYSGSPGFTPSDVSIALELRKNGTQTINFNSTVDLYQVRTVPGTFVQFANGGTVGTITLGSDIGGGLALAAGSGVIINNNALKVIGKGTINPGTETGTVNVSEGTIELSSSAAQSSNLYLHDTNNQINTLTSTLTGGGALNIRSVANITDGLKINAGTVNSNGNIVLVSTESKTANLQEILANGRVAGNVRVQRFVNAKPRVYRYIASPVAGIKVADWQNYFAITGPFDGASTGPGLGTANSMFIFTQQGYVGYPSNTLQAPYNTNQAPIDRGRGYATFMRNTSNFVLENVGEPYQGSVSFPVFPAQAGVEQGDWNLLGNPYASTIAWSNNTEAWQRTDINAIIAVRNNLNPTTGQFQYFDAETGLGTTEGGLLEGGRIAPGQAFWIHTTGPNPALTITEKAKSTGQQTLYREKESDISHLRITLSNGTKKDEALVVMTDFGTDDFDREYDGLKLGNDGVFNFSTLTANEYDVAINNMNDEFCTKRFKLNVQNVNAGDYSLSIGSFESLSGVGALKLIDHYSSKTIDLVNAAEYSFSITSDPASFGTNRFEIVMERPELDLSISNSVIDMCDAPAQVVLSNTQRGAMYTLVDQHSKEITEKQMSNGGELTFEIPEGMLSHGLNELHVQASFKGCSEALIPQLVQVEKYNKPEFSVADVSVCMGSTATLVVQTNENIASFEWYNHAGKIKGANGPSLETDPILEESYYFVAPVLPNGCVGEKQQLIVTPESLQDPEITFANDTLSTAVLASQYVWSFNGQELVAASLPVYLPENAGNYSLTVIQGGCSKTSLDFVVTAEMLKKGMFEYQLYPNPTVSDNINLNIVTGDRDDLKVTIIDILGRESFNATFSWEEFRRGLQLKTNSRLTPGVYFLTLEQNSKIRKVKFIIEK